MSTEPRLCGYCDRPGVFDANEENDYAPEEIKEPLATFTLGDSTDLFHPACYRDMMANEGCGVDANEEEAAHG